MLPRASTEPPVAAVRKGQVRYRNQVAAACQWFTRYNGGFLEDYKTAKNRVENSDVMSALAENPGIVRAVERSMPLRTLINPGIMGFLYYVISNRNPDVAEQMVKTLEDLVEVGVSDPFFRLRVYLSGMRRQNRHRDALTVIAITFKAANAAAEGKKLTTLSWRNQGKAPEEFPKLHIQKSKVNA